MPTDTARVAFEALVAEAYEPLQRYLRRRCAPADVDDVLNEVLLTIWRRLDDVPAHASLPWCYGVARRCLANHRRSGTRRLRLVERIGAGARGGDAFAWTDDADVALHEAVATLDELDREVVRLWAWEQLGPREIATVLDTTPNAVSVRLTRIRQRLRTELARKDPVPAGHEGVEDHSEHQP